jgi:hypothetical protein
VFSVNYQRAVRKKFTRAVDLFGLILNILAERRSSKFMVDEI